MKDSSLDDQKKRGKLLENERQLMEHEEKLMENEGKLIANQKQRRDLKQTQKILQQIITRL